MGGFYAARGNIMVLRKENLVTALKLFCEHFDINEVEQMQNFILPTVLIQLWEGKYASVPGPLNLYIKRHTHVTDAEPLKYRKLIGLFTGETIANYGGITEITVQINEYIFKVKPQPGDHEDSGVDNISRIIELQG